MFRNEVLAEYYDCSLWSPRLQRGRDTKEDKLNDTDSQIESLLLRELLPFLAVLIGADLQLSHSP